ncbi:MAG: hypothetical protein WCX65_11975 [bacterium]
MPESIEVHDGLNHWRCPQLGGPVPFKHCRRSGIDSLPCRKLAECWNSSVDVATFLSAAYSPEDIQKAFGSQAKSRLDIMLESIDRAGGAAEKDDG